MMTAAEYLIANSTLSTGTAASLLMNSKPAGTADSGYSYVEGTVFQLTDATVNFDILTSITNFEVDTAVVSFTAVAKDATDIQDNTTEVRAV